MKLFLRALACLFLLLMPAPSIAWPVRGAATSPSGSAGKTILNISTNEFRYGFFVNMMKASGSHGFTGTVTPGNLDDNLMPTGTLTGGTVSSGLYVPSQFFTSTTDIVFRASVGCVMKMTINIATNFQSMSATGVSVTGGTNNAMTVTFDGTGFAGGDARVVFRFPSYSAQLIGTIFPAGFTYNCPSTTAATGLKMFRLTDEAAFDADPYALMPEAKAAFQSLNIGAIRWMGAQNSNGNNLSRWSLRMKPSSLGWNTQFTNFVPGWWAGGGGVISGTDQYTVANAPNSPSSGFVDGEVIQGTFTNAATRIDVSGAVAASGAACSWATAGRVCLTVSSLGTVTNGQQVWIGGMVGTVEANGIHTAQIDAGDPTHIALSDVVFVNTFLSSFAHVTNQTINVGGRGIKRMGQIFGAPLWNSSSGQGPTAGQHSTLVFDVLLDCWMWNSGGATPDIPPEAMASVSNQLNVDLYAQIAAYVDDTYSTNFATAVRDNLNTNLVWYASWSNEIWNNAWTQSAWSALRAQALGLVHTNISYYSLRTRSIFATVIPAVFAGQMHRVVRVAEGQGSGPSGVGQYILQSYELAPAGVNTGTGNSTYCTWTGGVWTGVCTGGANYTQYPNRLRDYTDATAYAPYAGGTLYCFGADMSSCGTGNPGLAAGLQEIIVAYEAGNTAQVISLIDNDIRRGRTLVQNVTASGTIFTTPLAHGYTTLNNVICTSTGGSLYSGLVKGQMYQVVATNLTATTYTLRAYNNANQVVAPDINAGTIGTGTTSCGIVPNFRNLQQASVTWHLPWETMVTTLDTPVCSTSKAACGANAFGPLILLQYEGNLEPTPPSAAQCQAMSLVTVPPDASGIACNAKLKAALDTMWKTSNEAAATTRLYFAQFNGTDPDMVPTFGLMLHATRPGWLNALGGPGTVADYALSPATNFVDAYAQRYKYWDGFGGYTGVP